MNNDSGKIPEDGSSQPSDFDPHADQFSKRDWTIMAYFASLGVIPLLAVLVLIYFLLTMNPNFDNFPDPPKSPPLIEAGSVLR